MESTEGAGGDRTRENAGVERQILEQHRRLRGLFTDVREALQAGFGLEDARDALARLGEALDAHFEQEDRLYFPPIASLRPEHRARIAALAEEHTDFRERLARIARDLDSDARESSAQAFREFTADFGDHEKSEQKLLAELDRHLQAS